MLRPCSLYQLHVKRVHLLRCFQEATRSYTGTRFWNWAPNRKYCPPQHHVATQKYPRWCDRERTGARTRLVREGKPTQPQFCCSLFTAIWRTSTSHVNLCFGILGSEPSFCHNHHQHHSKRKACLSPFSIITRKQVLPRTFRTILLKSIISSIDKYADFQASNTGPGVCRSTVNSLVFDDLVLLT